MSDDGTLAKIATGMSGQRIISLFHGNRQDQKELQRRVPTEKKSPTSSSECFLLFQKPPILREDNNLRAISLSEQYDSSSRQTFLRSSNSGSFDLK
jgi:hypothetical protein